MLPKELEKQFNNVVSEKIRKSFETDEERNERVMRKLGIQKHGKGKRKRKKKGGKK